MSISFVAEDSPAGPDTVYVCPCTMLSGIPLGDIEPCEDCGGTGEVRFSTIEYDVTFANATAWEFTKLFTKDGQGEYCGTIASEDVPVAIEKLKTSFCDPNRKAALLPVLEWAAANNKSVYWG